MKDTSVASVGIVPEVLNFDNYDRWSVFMKNYLIGKGLWDVVISGVDDAEHVNTTPVAEKGFGDSSENASEANQRDRVSLKKKNAKALHIIQLSCGRQIQGELFHFEIARDAWNHLSTRYDKILKIIVDKVQRDDDAFSVEHKELFRKVKRGDYIEESKIDPKVYDVITSDLERTLLHIAVINSGNVTNVDILVRKGGDKFVTKKDKNGDTALSLAVCYNAKMEIIRTLVDSKTGKKLLMESNKKGEIPIHLAADKGYKNITKYLYKETPVEVFNKNSRNRVLLLDQCMRARIFDVALKLLKLYPNDLFNEATYGNISKEDLPLEESSKFSALVTLAKMSPISYFPRYELGCFGQFLYDGLSLKEFELEYGVPESEIAEFMRSVTCGPDKSLHRTSLVKSFLQGPLRYFQCSLVQLFVHLNIFGMKAMHAEKCVQYEVFGILKYFTQNIKRFNDLGLRQASAHEAMLYAAESGTIQFINAMREAKPDLLFVTDNRGRGIFSYAILNRNRKVFQLIYFLEGLEKEYCRYHTDSFDNNLVHMAAHAFSDNFSIDMFRLNPALKIQREIQWLQAVADVAHPLGMKQTNRDGKTPIDVFSESHEELVKAGVKWTKELASTYITVASLMLTVMFAAALTNPGGKDQQTILNEKVFNVFLIADVVSIFASASSVLVFIRILTSRFHEFDFTKFLPYNMVLGLLLLLLSGCSIMVAFYAALTMILKQNHTRSMWSILGPIISLGSIPVIILLASQLKFVYEALHSTMKNPLSSI